MESVLKEGSSLEEMMWALKPDLRPMIRSDHLQPLPIESVDSSALCDNRSNDIRDGNCRDFTAVCKTRDTDAKSGRSGKRAIWTGVGVGALSHNITDFRVGTTSVQTDIFHVGSPWSRPILPMRIRICNKMWISNPTTRQCLVTTYIHRHGGHSLHTPSQ